MGGFSINSSPERIQQQLDLINSYAQRDPADIPMAGNHLSPKAQYQSIKEDVNMANGDLPLSKYNTVLPINANRQIAMKYAQDLLANDSDVGRFANPGQGDQGQFFKKGGSVKHKAEHHEKSGKINLKHCKVSTHETNSKHKKCW